MSRLGAHTCEGFEFLVDLSDYPWTYFPVLTVTVELVISTEFIVAAIGLVIVQKMIGLLHPWLPRSK